MSVLLFTARASPRGPQSVGAGLPSSAPSRSCALVARFLASLACATGTATYLLNYVVLGSPVLNEPKIESCLFCQILLKLAQAKLNPRCQVQLFFQDVEGDFDYHDVS